MDIWCSRWETEQLENLGCAEALAAVLINAQSRHCTTKYSGCSFVARYFMRDGKITRLLDFGGEAGKKLKRFAVIICCRAF